MNSDKGRGQVRPRSLENLGRYQSQSIISHHYSAQHLNNGTPKQSRFKTMNSSILPPLHSPKQSPSSALRIYPIGGQQSSKRQYSSEERKKYMPWADTSLNLTSLNIDTNLTMSPRQNSRSYHTRATAQQYRIKLEGLNTAKKARIKHLFPLIAKDTQRQSLESRFLYLSNESPFLKKFPEHSPLRVAAPPSPTSQVIDEVVQVNLPLLPRTPHHAPVIQEEEVRKEAIKVKKENRETEGVKETERQKGEARKKRVAQVEKSGGVLLRKSRSKSKKIMTKSKPQQQLRVISHKAEALGMR